MTSPLTFQERFIFRHFFNGLALGGALAEWGIACWLLGVTAPASLHVMGVAMLAILNRVAARPLEREPATGVLAGRTGHVVLAAAFGGLACAGALAVTTGVWLAFSLLAFRAEASMLSAAGVEAMFGDQFRAVCSLVVGLSAVAVVHGYARGYRRLAVTQIAAPLAGVSLPSRASG